MRVWATILTLLFLTGCGGLKSFDCKPERGLKCTSISDTDKWIKQGKPSEKNQSGYTKQVTYDETTFPVKTFSNPPVRVPEQVVQLWIAPYQSDAGMYFQQSYVNVIVKPGVWIDPIVDDLTQQG